MLDKVGATKAFTFTVATLEAAVAQTPLCTTARYSVVCVSAPVESEFAVEGMSDQLLPSVEDCHLTMLPVWPVSVMFVPVPLLTAAVIGIVVPPTHAGLTVTVVEPAADGHPFTATVT